MPPMALIKCRGCDGEVSEQAAVCPSCGTALTPIPDSVRFTRKGGKWTGIGFALVVLGIVIGVVSNRALGCVVAIAGLVALVVARF